MVVVLPWHDPIRVAERNLQCLVKHVLPELKRWDTPPLVEPALLAASAPAVCVSLAVWVSRAFPLCRRTCIAVQNLHQML